GDLDPVAGLERCERPDDPALAGAPGYQADRALRNGSGKAAEGDEAAHSGGPNHTVVLVQKADVNEEVTGEERGDLIAPVFKDAWEKDRDPALLELADREVLLASLSPDDEPLCLRTTWLPGQPGWHHTRQMRVQFQCHGDLLESTDRLEIPTLSPHPPPSERPGLSHPCSVRAGSLPGPTPGSQQGSHPRCGLQQRRFVHWHAIGAAGLAAPHDHRHRCARRVAPSQSARAIASPLRRVPWARQPRRAVSSTRTCSSSAPRNHSSSSSRS